MYVAKLNVMNATITEEAESYVKLNNGNFEKTDSVKVLGVIWDSESDEFLFDLLELAVYTKSLPPTKCPLL